MKECLPLNADDAERGRCDDDTQQLHVLRRGTQPVRVDPVAQRDVRVGERHREDSRDHVCGANADLCICVFMHR